jgi:hypothetical protein
MCCLSSSIEALFHASINQAVKQSITLEFYSLLSISWKANQRSKQSVNSIIQRQALLLVLLIRVIPARFHASREHEEEKRDVEKNEIELLKIA